MKLLRSLTLATSLAGSLAFATPAMAQEEEAPQSDAAFAQLAAMFAVEPLTPEQEARLPLAGEVIDKMMPPGSLGEVMGQMFDGFLGPMMQTATQPKTADFATQLGLEAWELEMDEAAIAEAAGIVDPVRDERTARTAAVMPGIMTEMMNMMEPTMRKAMSEAFAINFDTGELTDINAFFSTESGAAFAKKSMAMSSDPRVLGASMEALPQMMTLFEDMEVRMAEATADLPEKRGFAELSADEQARIAELTGYTVDELAERAANADALEEAVEAAE